MVDAVCAKLDDEGMELFRRVVLEVAEDAGREQRRHTRKAIRAEIASVEAKWDEAARTETDPERRLYVAESCARIVTGFDGALRCVRAPRKRGGDGEPALPHRLAPNRVRGVRRALNG
jgi:hypothetical protein